MTQPKTKDTRPEWIKKITDSYAAGMSDIEVCRELDITMKTFSETYEENEGFRKLVDHGRMLSNAWWMEQGRKNLWNKEFVTPLWTFNMKNRFGWADKTEVNKNGEQLDLNTNLDDLRTKLHKALPKLLKNYAPELADAKLLQKITAEDREDA